MAQLDLYNAPSGSSPALDHCDSYQGVVPITDVNLHANYDTFGVTARWDDFAPYNWDLGAVEQTDIVFANGFGTRPSN